MGPVNIFSLTYRSDCSEVTSRLRRLFDARDKIVCAVMRISSKVITEFAENHKDGQCEFPDLNERIEFWNAYLAERQGINDDSIPSALLKEMDQGLIGGLFNGDVRFLCDTRTGYISSMVPPLLNDWDGFHQLKFSKEHPWFQRYMHQLKVFTEYSRDKFGISHLIVVNGLHFVMELVGATNAYLAIEDKPDMVRKAYEFALDVNIQVQESFFKTVPLLNGGVCSNFAQWLPGRIVSDSIDAFHMTSVDYFEKWGKGPVERLFAVFDGGIIHIHSNGFHLLESAATIDKLKAIFLSNEKGYSPAFEILPEIREKVGNIPLICNVDFETFQKVLSEQQLTTGVLYNVDNVPDKQTANQVARAVRKYNETLENADKQN